MSFQSREAILRIEAIVTTCEYCFQRYVLYHYGGIGEDMSSLLLPQIETHSSYCPYCGKQAIKERENG